jgi:pentafunctional AROM polypeptide
LRCIKAFGLPTRIPARALTADILVKMEVDKKNSGGVKKLILLHSIGKVTLHVWIDIFGFYLWMIS